MSNATALDLNATWTYEGWTDLDERTTDGAIDADGNLILVGIQGDKAVQDYPILDEIAGNFAAVKLLDSGEELWTWTSSSLDAQADIWISVDTDSNNDVSTVVRTMLDRGKGILSSFAVATPGE